MVTVSKKVSDQQKRWKLFIICSLLHCTNVPSEAEEWNYFVSHFFYRFSKVEQTSAGTDENGCYSFMKGFAKSRAKKAKKKVEENKNMKRCQCYIGRIFTYHIIYVRFIHASWSSWLLFLLLFFLSARKKRQTFYCDCCSWLQNLRILTMSTFGCLFFIICVYTAHFLLHSPFSL